MRRVLIIHDTDGVRELELVDETYNLGRARDNDIRLRVGTVSAHHAAIVQRDDDYWLQDLLSTNGTYVNGRRVQRRRLQDRDHVMLADCRIEFFDLIDEVVEHGTGPRTGQRTKIYSGVLLEEAGLRQVGSPTPARRVRHRKGEAGQIPYRSGRFFSAEGAWYFATREGTNVGPYDTLQLARAGLVDYGREVGFLAGFDDDAYIR